MNPAAFAALGAPPLASSVISLNKSLSTLLPQITKATSSIIIAVNASPKQPTPPPAVQHVHDFLEFLSSPSTPAGIIENGQLQSRLAHIFAAFALAEADALSQALAADAALAELHALQVQRIDPVLREFSGIKERALALSAAAFTELYAAEQEDREVCALVQQNRESAATAIKDLDDVSAALEEMAADINALEERAKVLEERKERSKVCS